MISIITVCHKSANLLPGYLASFLEHNAKNAGKGLVEFILVENSGDLETDIRASELRDQGFDVQVLMVENRGFGAGCNAGAQLARGDILAFVNPDIRFQTDISPISAEFSGARWGTIRQQDCNGSVYAFDLLPEYRSLATELLRVYRYLHGLNWLLRLCYPIGSFMIIPRVPFMEIDGFDERFFLYYEEAELSRRLQRKLGPPRFSSSVSILHEGFGTQSSTEFTFREEAKGMVTYATVTGQPALAKQRIGMLKKLAFLSKTAAQRVGHLQEAIRNRVG